MLAQFQRNTKKLTKPVVDPKVGKEVPDKQVGPAEVLANLIQSSSNNSQTNVTQQDQVAVLGIIQWAARVEVVDTTEETILRPITTAITLTSMLVVTSNVGEEICWPATDLLVEQMESSSQRCLLSQLMQFVGKSTNTSSELVPSLWHKHHITLHMTCSLVMLAMGDLPGEIWNKQKRVANPANSIIQDLAGRERLVTTLMSKYPQSGAEKSLYESITCPQSCSQWCGWDVLRCDEAVGQIKDSAE